MVHSWNFRNFHRDERGSATVEFVLWIPIIAALLTTVVVATTLYLTHAEMWNVARDTARRMSSGTISCEKDAEAYAVGSMSLRDYPYVVSARYDPAGKAEVMIALKVNDIPIADYSPLKIHGGNMVATVVMRADPRLPAICSSGNNGHGGNGNGGNGRPNAGGNNAGGNGNGNAGNGGANPGGNNGNAGNGGASAGGSSSGGGSVGNPRGGGYSTPPGKRKIS